MEQLFRASVDSRFPLNMNVLDHGTVPRVMSLKLSGLHWPPPRRAQRPASTASKDRARLEILEGYLAVFLNLDKVIKMSVGVEPKPS